MKKKEQIKNKSLLKILEDIRLIGIESFGEKLKEIILYGSYASGRQTDGSDVDIMFLFNENNKEISRYRDKIADIMVDLSLKYDVLVSITENSVEDFERYVSYIPFYENVYNEGVEIYAH